MYDRRLTVLLLLPSFFSGMLALAIAFFVATYNAWLYISANQLFYDYLFGAHGVQTYLWLNTTQATARGGALLSTTAAYYVLVAGVAVMAGLAVYTLLQTLSLFVRGGSSIWTELHLPGYTHRQMVGHLLGRLLLRIASLGGWLAYATVYLMMVLPFMFLLNQTGVDLINAGRSLGWLACAGTVLLFALTLHLHLVFLRLVFLRPRLLGGDRVIEEVNAQGHGLN